MVVGMTMWALALAVPGRAQTPTEPAPSSDIGGQVEGMVEQVQTLQSDMDRLKKFKFSGYVQARWETAENKIDTVAVTGSPPVVGTPANNERFYIRRARLKLTYDSSPLSQAVVYFDGGTDRTIRLLEAYVAFLDPWTVEHRHGLTIGQMNVPFGWEIERSSSVRELPERSFAENQLFSGERDRGAKLHSQWTTRLQTTFGIWNGGGVNDPSFPNTDPTKKKDYTARARWNQGWIEGGASYYGGKALLALSGADVELDRTRLGFDVQTYYELGFGGGSLRAESYSGVNPNSARITAGTETTGGGRRLLPGVDPSSLATDFLGGYVMWVQNFGDQLQIAGRYDGYDPDIHVASDQFDRVSMGINYFYDGFTRVTVSYDIINTSPTNVANNLWTVQFQHKF
jgi:hypothetical protein